MDGSKKILSSLLLISACSARPVVETPRGVLVPGVAELVSGASRLRPELVGNKGIVVSDDREASAWGAEILRQGGNAVDALMATAFYLSVSRPQYASLGGGGFLVYCPAPAGGPAPDCSSLDFRETAPAAAKPDLFLRNGKAVADLSRNGALAVGVPGNVAGWLTAQEKWGRLKRAQILRRPLFAAREGVRVSGNTEVAALDRWDSFNPEARRIFGCGEGTAAKPCAPGTVLKQPDLARVMEAIRDKGRAGFYEGAVAARIFAGLKAAGGILTPQDLAGYKPIERKVLHGNFRGYDVVSMPPPSSGGVLLLEMLASMELARAQGALGQAGSVEAQHAVIHAMRLAFADRAEHLGDPGFHRVPLEALLDPARLAQRWRASFDPLRAASKIEPLALSAPHEGQHTTHLVAVDRHGAGASMTITVNDNFGSAFVSPGTGVVLNNEMDDFVAQPGVPNLFGLVGGKANQVDAGKRPLSSMTPTIVRDAQGRVRLVLGAQGGPRIISAVFQTLVNRLDHGMSLPDAVSAPRVHHQWKPDEVAVEIPGFAPEVVRGLEAHGYKVKPSTGVGRLESIERFADGRVWGVPDPRTEGGSATE